jgi:hypothetical protein
VIKYFKISQKYGTRIDNFKEKDRTQVLPSNKRSRRYLDTLGTECADRELVG